MRRLYNLEYRPVDSTSCPYLVLGLLVRAGLQGIRENHPVIVDLSGVSYIDSSGIASLVEGLQAAKAKRLEFGLFGASPAALRVLKLARLETVFNFYPALPSANA